MALHRSCLFLCWLGYLVSSLFPAEEPTESKAGSPARVGSLAQLSSCHSMRQGGAGWHGDNTRVPGYSLHAGFSVTSLKSSTTYFWSFHLARVSICSLNELLPSTCYSHTGYLIGCSLCLHRTHRLEKKRNNSKSGKAETEQCPRC